MLTIASGHIQPFTLKAFRDNRKKNKTWKVQEIVAASSECM